MCINSIQKCRVFFKSSVEYLKQLMPKYRVSVLLLLVMVLTVLPLGSISVSASVITPKPSTEADNSISDSTENPKKRVLPAQNLDLPKQTYTKETIGNMQFLCPTDWTRDAYNGEEFGVFIYEGTDMYCAAMVSKTDSYNKKSEVKEWRKMVKTNRKDTEFVKEKTKEFLWYYMDLYPSEEDIKIEMIDNKDFPGFVVKSINYVPSAFVTGTLMLGEEYSLLLTTYTPFGEKYEAQTEIWRKTIVDSVKKVPKNTKTVIKKPTANTQANAEKILIPKDSQKESKDVLVEEGKGFKTYTYENMKFQCPEDWVPTINGSQFMVSSPWGDDIEMVAVAYNYRQTLEEATSGSENFDIQCEVDRRLEERRTLSDYIKRTQGKSAKEQEKIAKEYSINIGLEDDISLINNKDFPGYKTRMNVTESTYALLFNMMGADNNLSLVAAVEERDLARAEAVLDRIAASVSVS